MKSVKFSIFFIEPKSVKTPVIFILKEKANERAKAKAFDSAKTEAEEAAKAMGKT